MPLLKRRRGAWLTTEEQGDVNDVTEPVLRRILDEDAFGKFAILSRSAKEFMQAACEWDPSPECAAFLEQHGSDPWVLEYRDPATRKQFRAEGQLTLGQVRDAFIAYLNNETTWHARFSWVPVE